MSESGEASVLGAKQKEVQKSVCGSMDGATKTELSNQG